MKISKTDLVLEIGSGDRPKRRSNILCDKYPSDNTERSEGRSLKLDKRPFIVCDGAYLPFKDGSFDYIICSHIVEHIDNPGLFFRELIRVGRRGYIEAPSEIGEKLYGWKFHKWFVRIEDGALALWPKNSEDAYGQLFHNLYANDPLFRVFHNDHSDLFYVKYEWENVIKYKLVTERNSSSYYNSYCNTKLNPILFHLFRACLSLQAKIYRKLTGK